MRAVYSLRLAPGGSPPSHGMSAPFGVVRFPAGPHLLLWFACGLSVAAGPSRLVWFASWQVRTALCGGLWVGECLLRGNFPLALRAPALALLSLAATSTC